MGKLGRKQNTFKITVTRDGDIIERFTVAPRDDDARDASKPARIFCGNSHNDETLQARDYNAEIATAHRANGYHPETLVYRDGGTVHYTRHNRERFLENLNGRAPYSAFDIETTYSISKARDWYDNGDLVTVSTDARSTPFEIWNATRAIGRLYQGNGKIKFRYIWKGDECR